MDPLILEEGDWIFKKKKERFLGQNWHNIKSVYFLLLQQVGWEGARGWEGRAGTADLS